MPESEIYKCAECGRVITDKEYLHAVREHELKFCGRECTASAWRRIHEYVKSFHKFNQKPHPSTPPAPLKKNYRISEDERVRILEMSENGFDVKMIATIMQRSQSAVKNVIDNYVLVDADEAESGGADE
ncbi:MAG: hypothetical protein IJG06_02285 [Clostridia bacterium]|nr:hypothetical protein [Clostridia bacterium]MBR0470099.1 hypothetical protein [Clostridia bacterium]